MESKLVFKIIDFSISRNINTPNPHRISTRKYGSNIFIPPEIYIYTLCNKNSDCWSLGIMFLLLVSELEVKKQLKNFKHERIHKYVFDNRKSNYQISDEYKFARY
ncbi:hypothetical protein COBT_003557, partial [Conglomerata obtusa]